MDNPTNSKSNLQQDADNCCICLKICEELISENENNNFNYLLKCSNCSCNACNNCITRWYNNKPNCPQCRQPETFDVDIDIQHWNSVLGTNEDETDTQQLIALRVLLALEYSRINQETFLETIPPLPDYIVNGAEFQFHGMQIFMDEVWDNIPWQHIQMWKYEKLLVNGECVRIKICLRKQYDPGYILNQITGRWVKKLGSTGKQILKEMSKTELIQHPENPGKIMNPGSGKWVNVNGYIGRTVIEFYENQNQNVI